MGGRDRRTERGGFYGDERDGREGRNRRKGVRWGRSEGLWVQGGNRKI